MIDPKGFVLGPLLGRGAMGEVYEAVHTATGAKVAMKVVHATTAKAVSALENEVAAMARMNHSRLLYLYDYGRLDANGQAAVWMALEYVSGGTLADWQPPDWDAVHDVCMDLLEGLAHAHARGLVHRDIKPENLLRCTTADRRPGLKIADFGLAWAHDLSQGARRGGTPLYMPPEQFKVELGELGPWSDLYGLAAVIWHWVTGRPAFEGDTPLATMELHAEAELPAFEMAIEVPRGLEPLLRAMLRKDPQKRPANVAEVVRRFEILGPARNRPLEVLTPASAPLPGLGLGLLGQRDQAVHGQVDVRAEMVRQLKETLDNGASAVLLLTGPRGVGKTRLMRWLGETAAESGIARVISRLEDIGDAGKGPPTVVVLDDAEQHQQALVSLAFEAKSLVLVTTVIDPARVPELHHLPGFAELPVGPMEPGAFRHLLFDELGLAGELVVRMGEPCAHMPGRAVRWVEDLAKRGALRPTPQGLMLQGPLGEPPPPSKVLSDQVSAVLFELTEEIVLGLRLGALLGRVVDTEEWRLLLELFELQPRKTGVRALSKHGWVTRRKNQWVWRQPEVRELVLAGLAPLNEYHLAAATVLQRFPADPDIVLRRGCHLVRGGRVDLGRTLLLGIPDVEVEDLRTVVWQLSDHLEGASVEERFQFATLETRTILNFLSAVDAVGSAERLVRWSAECPDTVDILPGLRIAAAVFAFASRFTSFLEIYDQLPRTCASLRLRALVASDLGEHEEAYALLRSALDITDAHSHGRIANSLGSVSSRLGQDTQAVRWFRLAVEKLDPAVAFVARGNLAMALLRCGRFEEAARYGRLSLEGAQGHGPRRLGMAAVVVAVSATLCDDEALLAPVLDRAVYTIRRFGFEDADLLVELLDRADPAQLSPVCGTSLRTLRELIHQCT